MKKKNNFAVQRRDKTRKKESKFWSILKGQAAEFCRETGFHGYKYISQSQRSKPERIVWAIVVFVSLCCALFLIKLSWDFYSSNPTQTVIETTHHGIWNYPFPAITVCNINRVSYKLAKKFIDSIKIPSNISRQFLLKEIRLMTEMIVPGVFGYDVHKNLTFLQDVIDQNNLTILDVMEMISQNCSSLMTSCKWRGELNKCDEIFVRSVSRDGLCCSFNYHFTPGAIDNIKIPTLASCGHETALTILFSPEPGDYYASVIGSYGVKVIVHYMFDYPNHNSEIILIRQGNEYFMSVDPEEIYAKSELRKLSIPNRECTFHDEGDDVMYGKMKEKNLTYSTYTYHNCLAQCRASIARDKCGCIPFYYPQNSTRICNLRDIQCLKQNSYLIDTSWPGLNFSNKVVLESEKIKKGPCGCIPDCSLYRYHIGNSYGYFDKSIYFSNGSFTKNPDNAIALTNYSMLHVYFNDLMGFQYRRSVNYGWRNLFASFGGLLGLFVGFSLISIVEFVYFFVIRVISDRFASMRTRRRNDKQKRNKNKYN